MKITIYGAGYVGLITGVCMAQVGNDVLCVDVNEKKVEQLKNNILSIYEPDLDRLLEKNVATGRLRFTSSSKEGVDHGLFQFIAVDTPLKTDGSTDLSKVLQVAQTIAEHIKHYRIIIGKSTVPVGTSDKVQAQIKATLAQQNKRIEFDIVSNPEFLKEGEAIDDFMKPERIIIGSDNPRTTELMRELYTPFNRSRDRVVTMSVRSAELTKYAATALLATKISLMNELSNIAEILGADIEQVRLGIGSDPRIGYHFIYPGCGYGGTYFPKDIQALIQTAEHINYDAQLLHAVEAVNHQQKKILFAKLVQHYGETLKDRTIALWGLSFKPNTNDMHEASSRTLMEALWKIGAKVQAYDPISHQECEKLYGKRDNLTLCSSANAALDGADALAIVTEWQEFRSPDFKQIKHLLNDPVIVDGRNLYSPEHMDELGFIYYAIGRGL